MNISRSFFLRQQKQKRIFKRICVWSMLGGLGWLTACAPSQPQPANTTKPRLTSQQLETRIKRIERNQSRLIQKLQTELSELKQSLKQSEQLKRNQNILLLNLQGQFDERMAQIEKKLSQNKPSVGKQAGTSEQATLGKIPTATQSSKPEATQPSSASKTPVASLPPLNADQIFETGWDLHQKKEYLKAIEVFRKFKQTYPQHPNAIEAHYLIGDSYFFLEDYPNAAVEFFDFVDQNPQYPSTYEAQWKLAQALEKSGEVGLALDIYQELAQGSSSYREKAQESLKRYEQK